MGRTSQIWAFGCTVRRASFLALLALAAAHSPVSAQTAGTCEQTGRGIGVSRTIEIDASTGALFGSVTKQAREASFLKRKEVVLTFDDGPMPWVTKSILDTLDTFCTKATFFSVGRMALAYPATVRDILARGHTLGSHTFSHPYHLPSMKPDAARAEVERGLAAVATAAGAPIAPFFRFPGLSDSASLLDRLQKRRIATFTVDVVSNDSYISDPQQLVSRTLAEVEANGGGIILFHDIKTVTAKALPHILSRLADKGYKVVHLVPTAPAEPLPELMAEYAPRIAKAAAPDAKKNVLLPFYGAIGPEKENMLGRLAVTAIKPEARNRLASRPAALTKTAPLGWAPVVRVRAQTEPSRSPASNPKRAAATTSGWVVQSGGDSSGPPVIIDAIKSPEGKGQWTPQAEAR
jgi:peptidoglycan-N-acetylglucosamine deacetylase